MKRAVFVVVGVLLVLTGVVWTLQGLGYVGGSVMSGVTMWAIIGPVVAVVGVALVVAGVRAGRSAPCPEHGLPGAGGQKAGRR